MKEFEGFISQEIVLTPSARMRMEKINGKNYRSYILGQSLLYPQYTGKVQLPEGNLSAVLWVRTKKRTLENLDDYSASSYTAVKKQFNISSVPVEIMQLPEEKPESFSGAIGTYTISSEIDKDTLKENEEVTVRVHISGKGNIKLFKAPELKFPYDFDESEPVSELRLKSKIALSGSRIIEYKATPRFAGDFTIPPVLFSYFNPESATYEVLSTPSYTLHVKKDENKQVQSAEYYLSGANKENIRIISTDIRYIKTGNIRQEDNQTFIYGSTKQIAWYIIPSLFLLVLGYSYHQKEKVRNHLTPAIIKSTFKKTKRQMKQALACIKENRQEEFNRTIYTALENYLSEVLEIPSQELTHDSIREELHKHGVEEPLAGEFINLIETYEYAEYTPENASYNMTTLYKATVQTIGKIEKLLLLFTAKENKMRFSH